MDERVFARFFSVSLQNRQIGNTNNTTNVLLERKLYDTTVTIFYKIKDLGDFWNNFQVLINIVNRLGNVIL